ncbi:Uncharacterised protein [Bordetella pertussis]|nr:Uncharacterised protein [Bordetella pertussis]
MALSTLHSFLLRLRADSKPMRAMRRTSDSA